MISTFIFSHKLWVLHGIFVVFIVVLFLRQLALWLSKEPYKYLEIDTFLLFLSIFIFLGYTLQVGMYYVLGSWGEIVDIIFLSALGGSLVCYIVDNRIKALLTPRDVLCNNFLGYTAVICSEKAKVGQIAEAILRDKLGSLHTIYVEPEYGELLKNRQVQLIYKKEHYYVVRPMVGLITDD